MRRSFGKILGSSMFVPQAKPDTQGAPVDIGSRRELFVDRELIAEMRVGVASGSPVDVGLAFKLDRPWEGRFSNYTTGLADRSRFRMYYRGAPVAGDGGSNEVTCCAESADGIHWTRPDLDYYEVAGARRNNVILAHDSPFSHNFTPFLDGRAGVPAEERDKALAGQAKTGLFAFVSPDGLKWTKRQGEPALPPPSTLALDSQNIAFWSAHENRYVLYYRTWKKIGKVNYRWASRAVSDDFRHFTPAGEMDFGDAPPEHSIPTRHRNTFGRRTFTSATAPALCRGGRSSPMTRRKRSTSIRSISRLFRRRTGELPRRQSLYAHVYGSVFGPVLELRTGFRDRTILR